MLKVAIKYKIIDLAINVLFKPIIDAFITDAHTSYIDGNAIFNNPDKYPQGLKISRLICPYNNCDISIGSNTIDYIGLSWKVIAHDGTTMGTIIKIPYIHVYERNLMHPLKLSIGPNSKVYI